MGPDEDGDCEVDFMRRSEKIKDRFQFPEEVDTASIELDDIVALPMGCVLSFSYHVVCCLVYCWTIVLIHSSNKLIRESCSDKREQNVAARRLYRPTA